MTDKLMESLQFISDGHIAEAAEAKKRRTPFLLGAIAAILAIVLLVNGTGIPMTVQAEAVSLAQYPQYQWKYRENMSKTQDQLTNFFSRSIRATLSGAEGNNQVYSPTNLYMALAIAAELTGGATRDQILSQFDLDSIEALRSQSSELWNAVYFDDGDQTLLANSLWLDEELSYNQAVMDTLADTYYTSVYRSDLGSSRSNQAIRTWLNNQTGGLLKKEVQNAGFDPDSLSFPVFALYSTVYYQSKWVESCEFNAANNERGVFHSPDGDQTVTYMKQKEMQSYYYWGEDFGAVSLGLKDSSTMWLILPDEGKTVDDVLASGEYLLPIFSRELYEPYTQSSNSKYMKINLSLPKFDIHAGGDLKEDIQDLGITDIFDAGTADFSGSISGDYPVWVSAVNQATRVAVDEKGVTAASYIELPGAGAAMPPEEIIDFVLDRPFIFVIANRYALPLFAGVVNEP